MRALVATRESQGARPDDFDHCLEGELVWVQEPCERDRTGDDCGCSRAFAGMASHHATTTAVVRDLSSLTLAAYEDTLRMSLEDQGWPAVWTRNLIEELLAWSSAWPEGTVLERRYDMIGRRFDPGTGSLRPPMAVRLLGDPDVTAREPSEDEPMLWHRRAFR